MLRAAPLLLLIQLPIAPDPKVLLVRFYRRQEPLFNGSWTAEALSPRLLLAPVSLAELSQHRELLPWQTLRLLQVHTLMVLLLLTLRDD
jgi:hypothetical protein